MASAHSQKSYRQFIHNIGWNLFGQIAPLIAAVVSIPLLIKGLGIDRFGVVTIAWMLIGYFSLFDLGIGRALTQVISEKLARNEFAVIPSLIWTGLTVMFFMGLVACFCIIGFSDWIVFTALKIPTALQAEAKQSLLMLAPSVPLVLLATGLRGILEAKHEFKSVNLVRIPLGVLMFAAPLCVLPFSSSLVATFFSLLLVRIVTTLAFLFLCHKSIPNFFVFAFSKKVIPELLKFGGWMTVSNIVSPVMVQMDRFAIGSMLSMAAVAYYATPFEMVTKILVVPAAIAGVCFPQFSQLLAKNNVIEAKALYQKSCKYALYLILPVVVIVILGADFILRIWLNGKFGIESTHVFQILAVGVLFNGIANIPFACLQGASRADLTAKVHVAELVFYVPLLYFSVLQYGIIGAACVWSFRVICDGYILNKLVYLKILKPIEVP